MINEFELPDAVIAEVINIGEATGETPEITLRQLEDLRAIEFHSRRILESADQCISGFIAGVARDNAPVEELRDHVADMRKTLETAVKQTAGFVVAQTQARRIEIARMTTERLRGFLGAIAAMDEATAAGRK